MRIALAQTDPTVGDIAGNTERILANIDRAAEEHADLVVTSELDVFGYPPRDLALRRDLIEANVRAVEQIAKRCTSIAAIVGFIRATSTANGKGITNSAAVCRNGVVEATYDKMLLPTYDVFDEWRYFDAGSRPLVVDFGAGAKRRRAAITICEDIWNDRQFEGRRVYGVDPVALSIEAGAELLINLSASPYRAGIQTGREALFGSQARDYGVPLVYVNQVGGNDDLIFDGASTVFNPSGGITARAAAFAEDFMLIDLDEPGEVKPYPNRIGEIRAALVLGVRDYIHKCGFERVLVGVSGGVDSAVTAALAVEAVGANAVLGVAMPSRVSSEHSLEDAQALARNLGFELMTIPIEDVHLALEGAVAAYFEGHPPDVTEENMQARIRGTLLMALSNKFGRLLLTTGNKSELAVGYCTLYGDMCGGLAVLSDVPKTTVFELAREINRTKGPDWIPERTIEKPPSAELRADQFDQDVLPPYDVLDAILELYVEQDRAPDEIASQGFDAQTVDRVVRMVRRSEYKRKQAAVGLKVTSRAFGTGRRMPIAARYP